VNDRVDGAAGYSATARSEGAYRMPFDCGWPLGLPRPTDVVPRNCVHQAVRGDSGQRRGSYWSMRICGSTVASSSHGWPSQLSSWPPWLSLAGRTLGAGSPSCRRS